MLHSLLEQGDEVIVPSPNWPNMKWAVVLAGATAAFFCGWYPNFNPCWHRLCLKFSTQVDGSPMFVMYDKSLILIHC